MPDPVRPCKATTNAGNPCRARRLADEDYCSAHHPNPGEKTRFRVGHSGPGRPRNPKPAEVARALIEANELALQRPYWLALGFDVRLGANGPELVELVDGGAKLYGVSGKDGTVRVSVHEDLEAMQRAAERLQDRVYGKPKQMAEVTTVDGGTLAPVLPPDDPGRAAEVRELLERATGEPDGGEG